jgi:hypothetical protein
VIRKISEEREILAHPSETEAMEIPDTDFDHIIRNDCSLQELKRRVSDMTYVL